MSFYSKFSTCLISSLFFATGILSQDLRFVTNIGHRSTITFLQEAAGGQSIVTATDADIIVRDVRSGRIIFRWIANGEYLCVNLSTDKSQVVAFESVQGNYLIHRWNLANGELLQSVSISGIVKKFSFYQFVGVAFFVQQQQLVWITSSHVYAYHLPSGRLAIDPGMPEGSRYIQLAATSSHQLAFFASDYRPVTNITHLYAVDMDQVTIGHPAASVTQLDSVIKLQLTDTDTLLAVTWKQLLVIDTKTGIQKKHKLEALGLMVTYTCTLDLLRNTNICRLASNGRVLEIDLVSGKKRIVEFNFFNFDRSCFSSVDREKLYGENGQRLILLSLSPLYSGDGQLVKAYDEVTSDGPPSVELTPYNQLICASLYTNTPYNRMNLSRLTFTHISSTLANVGRHVLIPEKNQLVGVEADYSSSNSSQPSGETYWLKTYDLSSDSSSGINLNRLHPKVKWYYPRIAASGDSFSVYIFNEGTVYLMNYVSGKVMIEFPYPAQNTGYNNSVTRPVLILSENKKLVLADKNIVLYDVQARKVLDFIVNDSMSVEPFSVVCLNHDSTEVVFRKFHRIYSFNLQRRSTDTVGFFSGLTTLLPITMNKQKCWLLGYETGMIELRDQNFNTTLFSCKAHIGSVIQLLFDTAYHRFISVGSDDMITFLDAGNLRIQAKALFLSRNSYREMSLALLDTSNHYYVPANLTDALHLVVNGKAYDYASLDPYLNRPDLLASKLQVEKDVLMQLRAAALLRQNRIHLKDSLDLKTLPKCFILNRQALPYSTDSSTLLLSVASQPGRFPLWRLIVKSNNIVIAVHQLKVVVNKTVSLSVPVILVDGNNHLQVIAEDSSGNRSLAETVDIRYKSVRYNRGRLWYIGIGISSYRDSTRKLDFAAKDVKDIAALVKDRTFRSDTTIAWTDAKATKEQIRQLRSILARAAPEDKVMVYYSGHGARTNTGFKFCPYETDFNNIEYTGYAIDSLLSLFADCAARKRLLLIDACESGDLIGEGETAVLSKSKDSVKISDPSQLVEFYNSYFNNFSNDYGVQIIAASYGANVAIEKSKLDNGLFTYCIIQGLFERKADEGTSYAKPASFYPTLEELRRYLYETIKRMSHGEQVPSSMYIDAENNWEFQRIFIDL